MAYMRDSNGERLDGLPIIAAAGLATKRAAYSCGIPHATATGAGTEAVQRHEVTLPVASRRWRLHVRNWRPSSATVIAGAIPFNGAWVGPAAFNATGSLAGMCKGEFSETPVQALSAFTTPADGSEYVSGWVTDPDAQFPALTPCLLSMGWVGGPTSQARMSGGARGFYKEGSGVAAQASAQVVSGAIPALPTTTVFDIWIEYEFVGTQPIGFALGDSLTAGYTLGSVNTAGVPLPATWPHAYALLSGCPMINAGSSGIGAAALTGPSNGMYEKWNFGDADGLTVPDFAVVWLGINDANGEQPIGSVTGYYEAIVDNLRGLGIERIYLVALPPFGVPFGFVHGTLLAPAAAGATSLVTSVAFNPNQYIVLDYGLGTREQVQVTAAGSSGSSAPFTTPVAALGQTHVNGAQVWATKEAVRRDYNAYLRRIPHGVDGVIDFEAVIASPADPFVVDPFIASSDLGHLNIAGYRRAAHAVPSRLVVPV